MCPPESTDGPDAAGAAEWLILVYRVPSEPTRLRATVWRRLKGLGAVYLQNSIAALPKAPAAERALQKLRHEILQMSGTAVLMSSTVLAGESHVLNLYQKARTDEYEEIIDRCTDFLAGIEKEHNAQHFTYAELEENEVDHTKLINWLAKIRARDTFQAPGSNEVDNALAKCAQALEDYAARVYTEESEAH
ncbi:MULTISPECIES: Chromate resistance protein ChrB [Arthrobacter]|uniref:Chromate resistance protein ChrB n=1 Tax=Arthrobacter ramosus TaxID=1672 RepID=A0ABV5Y399_ARTRM|nr:Chromate resistance protein ChrB [Arthrobacter ramosus]